MILVGWGGKQKKLGETFLIACPNCNNDTVWQVIETSKRITLYFVPVAKWAKEYFLVCPVCSAGLQLRDRDEAEDLLLQVLEGKQDLLEEIAARLRDTAT
jgi:transcription elongation factor Elf1